MADDIVTERVPTYVKGLDEHIEGGIPAGQVVVLLGEPGTMKSSLAYSVLFNNAKKGKGGLYVSLEQGRRSLIQQMRSLGMKHAEVEEQVSILDLAILRKKMKLGKKSWLEVFKMYATNLRKSLNYEILVIDSLAVIEVLSEFKDPRVDLFEFFEWLRDQNVTTFLPAEIPTKGEMHASYGEDYLADAIVHLKMEHVDDVNIQRRIRVIKMRATNHNPNYFTLLHNEGRFQVTRVITES
jgi:KaiC/GvpD/RAD55 family RecA-like ATPase